MSVILTIQRLAEDISKAVDYIAEHQVDLTKTSIQAQLLDAKGRKEEYHRNVIRSYPKSIRAHLMKLNDVQTLIELTKKMESSSDVQDMKRLALQLIDSLDSVEDKKEVSASFSLPQTIKGEVEADLEEIQRCFNGRCYRSAVILCGRILESCLHRKYYDITGRDILETNPGIGLGKLVAKLKELDIRFDPGLTEQIHLINQMRIYSVHKSQDVFMPSENQARAMVLYTTDIIKKLF